jgi:hypothetical protein
VTDQTSIYHFGRLLLEFVNDNVDDATGIDWWYGLPDSDVHILNEGGDMTVVMYPLNPDTNEANTSAGIVLASMKTNGRRPK